MKKSLLLIILSIVSFNVTHADITWKLSDDGTLTILGTDMPDYFDIDAQRGVAPWYREVSKINKIVIENGVTNIGTGAFQSCYNATSVTIPNSVTSIGDAAFMGCSQLTSITVPNSITRIGRQTFRSCMALTSFTIPDNVTSIGENAFMACKSLTSITIPNSVTNIDEFAFIGCMGLTTITISNSVTSIGESAFDGCLNLVSIVIPNSVTEIKTHTFNGCWNLASVTIPSSVKIIRDEAFSYCSALTSVTNLATTPQEIGACSFHKYGTLHVLPGCKAAYEAAEYWKNFTIVEDAVDIQSETTGIADAETDNGMKDGKYIVGGKLVIVKNGKKFNLNGIAE